MVGYLPHCTFGLNPRAASIDTPLHAFIPHPHVDHMHPDAVIAIATAKDGERLTAEVFGGRLGFLPWQRPGFDLGLKLEALARSRPELDGILLGGHGLFTWGETARACYQTTLRVIQQAADYLAAQGRPQPFGPLVVPTLSPSEKTALVAELESTMYLKYLSVEGFKSFPERNGLELTPGTCVLVGGNGTGKSNLADAVCWVLGQNNSDSLRVFRTAPGRSVVDCWSVRLASFRTSDIRRIRVMEPSQG
jgi:hypothetical protein